MTLACISDLLRDRLIHITNVSINYVQWSHASLPVKVGGLGLRSPMKLALSTFLASVSNTLKLQNDLLRNCQVLPDDQFNSYLFRWTTSFQPLPPPIGTAASKQHSWDAPFAESSFAILLASNTTGLDYLLLQLLTVVTGYTYYQFHSVDCVLTTTLLESLLVFGLASTYVIFMSTLVALSFTVVTHMVNLANEVQAN